MALPFNVVVNLQVQARGVGAAAAQIRRQLQGALGGVGATRGGVGLAGGGSAAAASQIAAQARSLAQVQAGALGATSAIQSFAGQMGLATRRFAAFTAGVFGFAQAIRLLRAGLEEAVGFQKEMVRLAQVSSETADRVSAVGDEVRKLAQAYGVSGRELAKTAVTLKQAGFSVDQVRVSLEALAKSSLAPNFDNLANTAEGAIAVMQQFRVQANQLEGALASMNAVAGAFAIEARDLITGVQKAGGSFAQAGGQLNEFLALMTSVRQTTRESADTIATGLRTIFVRVQRPETVQALEELGIHLRRTRQEAIALGDVDLEGQFVGGYEAVRRLSEGLAKIPRGDPRFAAVLEQLGGYRQISKVVPLIEQFAVAQRALTVANAGSISLTASAEKAQGALATRVGQVREEFLNLFRAVGQDQSFQRLADQALGLARSIIQVTDALRPLLPVLAGLGVGLLARAVFSGATAAFGRGLLGGSGAVSAGVAARVRPRGFARGGVVPGVGNTDSVPAMLEPGEFVIRKSSARNIGYNRLARLNDGGVRRYAAGGRVSLPPRDARRLGAYLRYAQVDRKLAAPGEGLVVSFGEDAAHTFTKLLGEKNRLDASREFARSKIIVSDRRATRSLLRAKEQSVVSVGTIDDEFLVEQLLHPQFSQSRALTDTVSVRVGKALKRQGINPQELKLNYLVATSRAQVEQLTDRSMSGFTQLAPASRPGGRGVATLRQSSVFSVNDLALLLAGSRSTPDSLTAEALRQLGIHVGFVRQPRYYRDARRAARTYQVALAAGQRGGVPASSSTERLFGDLFSRVVLGKAPQEGLVGRAALPLREEILPDLRARFPYRPEGAAQGGQVRLAGGGQANPYRIVRAPGGRARAVLPGYSLSSQLTPDEVLATRFYSRKGDTLINAHLRGEEFLAGRPELAAEFSRPGVRERAARKAGSLSSAVAKGKLPGGVVLYRGVTDTSFLEQQLGGPLDSPGVVGKIFSDKGFTSTSLSESVARGRSGGGKVLRIQAGGKSGLFLNRPALTKYLTEAEALLPAGARFKVLGADQNFVDVQMLARGGQARQRPAVRLAGGGVLQPINPLALSKQNLRVIQTALEDLGVPYRADRLTSGVVALPKPSQSTYGIYDSHSRQTALFPQSDQLPTSGGSVLSSAVHEIFGHGLDREVARLGRRPGVQDSTQVRGSRLGRAADEFLNNVVVPGLPVLAARGALPKEFVDYLTSRQESLAFGVQAVLGRRHQALDPRGLNLGVFGQFLGASTGTPAGARAEATFDRLVEPLLRRVSSLPPARQVRSRAAGFDAYLRHEYPESVLADRQAKLSYEKGRFFFDPVRVADYAGGGQVQPFDVGFLKQALVGYRVGAAQGDIKSVLSSLKNPATGKKLGKDFVFQDEQTLARVLDATFGHGALGRLKGGSALQNAASRYQDLNSSVNPVLRYGTLPGAFYFSQQEKKNLLEVAAGQDRVLKKTKLPFSTHLYRGVVGDNLPDFAPGSVVTDKAFVYTSPNRKVAEGYARNSYIEELVEDPSKLRRYLLNIVAPKGLPAFYGAPTVEQVILGRNLPLEVLERNQVSPDLTEVLLRAKGFASGGQVSATSYLRGNLQAAHSLKGKTAFPAVNNPFSFAQGGSSQDSVPALLTPGEFVLRKEVSSRLGRAKLNALNKTGNPEVIQRFARGGLVKMADGGDPPTSRPADLTQFKSLVQQRKRALFELRRQEEAQARAARKEAAAREKAARAAEQAAERAKPRSPIQQLNKAYQQVLGQLPQLTVEQELGRPLGKLRRGLSLTGIGAEAARYGVSQTQAVALQKEAATSLVGVAGHLDRSARFMVRFFRSGEQVFGALEAVSRKQVGPVQPGRRLGRTSLPLTPGVGGQELQAIYSQLQSRAQEETAPVVLPGRFANKAFVTTAAERNKFRKDTPFRSGAQVYADDPLATTLPGAVIVDPAGRKITKIGRRTLPEPPTVPSPLAFQRAIAYGRTTPPPKGVALLAPALPPLTTETTIPPDLKAAQKERLRRIRAGERPLGGTPLTSLGPNAVPGASVLVRLPELLRTQARKDAALRATLAAQPKPAPAATPRLSLAQVAAQLPALAAQVRKEAVASVVSARQTATTVAIPPKPVVAPVPAPTPAPAPRLTLAQVAAQLPALAAQVRKEAVASVVSARQAFAPGGGPQRPVPVVVAGGGGGGGVRPPAPPAAPPPPPPGDPPGRGTTPLLGYNPRVGRSVVLAPRRPQGPIDVPFRVLPPPAGLLPSPEQSRQYAIAAGQGPGRQTDRAAAAALRIRQRYGAAGLPDIPRAAVAAARIQQTYPAQPIPPRPLAVVPYAGLSQQQLLQELDKAEHRNQRSKADDLRRRIYGAPPPPLPSLTIPPPPPRRPRASEYSLPPEKPARRTYGLLGSRAAQRRQDDYAQRRQLAADARHLAAQYGIPLAQARVLAQERAASGAPVASAYPIVGGGTFRTVPLGTGARENPATAAAISARQRTIARRLRAAAGPGVELGVGRADTLQPGAPGALLTGSRQLTSRGAAARTLLGQRSLAATAGRQLSAQTVGEVLDSQKRLLTAEATRAEAAALRQLGVSRHEAARLAREAATTPGTKFVTGDKGQVLATAQTYRRAQGRGIELKRPSPFGFAPGSGPFNLSDAARERFRAFAGFGLPFFVAPAIAEALSGAAGDPQAAAAAGAPRTYRSLKGAGGAIQTGAIGAAVAAGVGAGPIGIAITATGAALFGLVQSVNQASAEIREAKILNALSVLSDKINAVALGVTDPAVRQSAVRQFQELDVVTGEKAAVEAYSATREFLSYFQFVSKAFGRQGYQGFDAEAASAIRSKEVRAQFGGQLPQLYRAAFGAQDQLARGFTDEQLKQLDTIAGGKQLGAGLTENFLKTEFGRQSLGTIARTRGLDEGVIREEFVSAARDALRLEAERRRGRDLSVQTAQSAGTFTRLADSAEAAALSIEGLRTQSAALGDLFEGVISPARLPTGLPALERLGGSPTGLQTPLGILRGVGGEGGQGLASSIEAANRVARVLPAVLANVIGEGVSESLGFEPGVRKGILNQLGVAGEGQLDDDTVRTINSVLGEIRKRQQDFEALSVEARGDPAGLARKIVEAGVKPQLDQASRFIQAVAAQTDTLSEGFAQFERRQGQVRLTGAAAVGADLAARRLSLGFQAQRQGFEPLDRLGVGELEEPFLARQRALLPDGTSPVDPAAIRRAFEEAAGKSFQAEQRLRTVVGTPGVAQTQLDQAAGELAKFRQQAADAQQALKNLAEGSEKLAAINEKLARLQQDRDARLGVAERFVRGGFEGQAELNRGIALAYSASRQGSLDAFSRPDQSLILDALRTVGQAQLTGFPGKPTGQGLADTLLRKSFGGTFDLDPARKKEETALQTRAEDAARTQTQAFQELKKVQEDIQSRFLNNLSEQSSTFFANLERLFKEDKLSSQTQRLAQAGFERDRLEKLVTARDTLAGVGVGDKDALDRFLGAREQLDALVVAQQRLKRLQQVSVGGAGQDLFREVYSPLVGDLRARSLPATTVSSLPTAAFGQVFESALDRKYLERLTEAAARKYQLTDTERDVFQRTFVSEVEEQVPYTGAVAPLGTQIPAYQKAIDKATQVALRSGIASARGQVGAATQGLIDRQLPADAIAKSLAGDPERLKKLFEQGQELSKAGIEFGQLNQRLADATAEFERLKTSVASLSATIDAAAGVNTKIPFGVTPQDLGYARGGPVYANRGGHYGPRGTDTIPAWLSPNEFVVRASQARANRGLLEKINQGTGPVYLAEGGFGPGPRRRGLELLLALGRLPIPDVGGGFGNLPVEPPPPFGAGPRPEGIPAAGRLGPQTGLLPVAAEGGLGGQPVVTNPLVAALLGLGEAAKGQRFGAGPRPQKTDLVGRLGGNLPIPDVGAGFGGRAAAVAGKIDPFDKLAVQELAERDRQRQREQALELAIRREIAINPLGASAGALARRRGGAGAEQAFFRRGQATLARQASLQRTAVGRAVFEKRREAQDYLARQVGADRLPEVLRRDEFLRRQRKALGFAAGGEVPIIAHAGEFVLPKASAQALGGRVLKGLQHFAGGGWVGKEPAFAQGGLVPLGGGGQRPVGSPGEARADGAMSQSLGAFAKTSIPLEKALSAFASVAPGLSESLGRMSELSGALAGFGKSVGGFENAVSTWATSADGLSKALAAFPSTLSIQGRQSVDVNIKGGEVLGRLTDAVKESVTADVVAKLQAVFRRFFPDSGAKIE